MCIHESEDKKLPKKKKKKKKKGKKKEKKMMDRAQYTIPVVAEDRVAFNRLNVPASNFCQHSTHERS